MPKLQNLVIDKMHAVYDRYETVPTDIIAHVYDRTHWGSKLRLWLVTMCTLLEPHWFSERNGFIAEMLVEYAAFVHGKRPGTNYMRVLLDDLELYYVPVEEGHDDAASVPE